MKISELIEILQQNLAEHGDIDVTDDVDLELTIEYYEADEDRTEALVIS